MGDGAGVPLGQMFASLWRGRRLMVICTGAGLLLGIAIALFRPRTYTSQFSFIAQGASDILPSGLTGLADQFGVSLASLSLGAPTSQFSADLLVTRQILAPVAEQSFHLTGTAQPIPLSQLLGVSGTDEAMVRENTIRTLQWEVVSAPAADPKSGIVTMNVRTRWPMVSREIAAALLKGLNDLTIVTQQGQARDERAFTEARLNEARLSQRVAEDAMERFLASNRRGSLAPALLAERNRLEREMQFRQQEASELAQKVEENRLRELRDVPIITVLETPQVPEVPDQRMTLVILTLGLSGGLLLGILVVVLRGIWSGALLTEAGQPAGGWHQAWQEASR